MYSAAFKRVGLLHGVSVTKWLPGLVICICDFFLSLAYSLFAILIVWSESVSWVVLMGRKNNFVLLILSYTVRRINHPMSVQSSRSLSSIFCLRHGFSLPFIKMLKFISWPLYSRFYVSSMGGGSFISMLLGFPTHISYPSLLAPVGRKGSAQRGQQQLLQYLTTL